MEESLILDGVRSVFAMLDRMVYSLISIFYNTIMDLANVQILGTGEINKFTGRIYALIGIFMLFKISFSLVNYLVDPDKIVDKSQGAGNLIKNIVITFVLIISVPFAFDMLYEAQSAILSDQIIPKFIFGTSITSSDVDMSGKNYSITMYGCEGEPIDNIKSMGNYIGLAIFRPFFVPEENTDETKGLPEDMKNWYCTAGSGAYDGAEPSVKNLLGTSDLYNAPKGFSATYLYDMDYSFFLSTAIGVVVALILLSFCFDVAVRVLKLLFLEIVAPIPIMSFIDPNSSKNGTFSKWLKEVSGTWVSLFTRLASLFLAVYVIQIISVNDNLYFLNTYEFNGNITWLKLLLIIGALIFAKQLPKMAEDVLGFKLGGNMTLNPFKKLDQEALGFKEGRQLVGKVAVAGGSAALAAGGAMIAHNRFKKSMAADKDKLNRELLSKYRQDAIDKIEEQHGKDLRNAKNNAEYEYANKLYTARMNELYKNGGIFDKQVKDRANKESEAAVKEKYNKYSNNHPLAAGIAAAGRAASSGFTSGAKSVSDAFNNMANAAKQAAKTKIANDNLRISDRIDDFITDISGVKNESGTTSKVKEQIKTATESLNDINNSIQSLNYSLGDLQRENPGAINYDSNGRMTVNQNSGLDDVQKQQLQATLNQYYELRSLQKTRQKELNTLNDILNKPGS